jgi:DNA-binding NarL/FixJ family response regulator
MTATSTPETATILVLDAQSVWLRAVASILQSAGFTATSLTSSDEALKLLRRGGFDVIMFGVDSAGSNLAWTQVVSRIKKVAPGTKLIIVGNDDDPATVERTFETGADAYVVKRAEPEDLLFAIRQVLEPAVYHVSPSMRPRRSGDLPSPRPFGLTRRESEVLELIAEGRSNAEIARRLKITEQTVKGHLWRLYRKLEVPNRTAAARVAETAGRPAAPSGPGR